MAASQLVSGTGCAAVDSGLCTILNAEYVCRAVRRGLCLAEVTPPGQGEVTLHPESVETAARPLTDSRAGALWFTLPELGAYRTVLYCRLLAEWVHHHPADIPAAPAAAELSVLEQQMSGSCRLRRGHIRCRSRTSYSPHYHPRAMCLGGHDPLCRSSFLPHSWLSLSRADSDAMALISGAEGHVAAVAGPAGAGDG